MKNLTKAITLVTFGVVFCWACGSSTEEAGPTAPPEPTKPAAAPGGAAQGGLGEPKLNPDFSGGKK